jgi:outer membrane protein, heavy metal efflux system
MKVRIIPGWLLASFFISLGTLAEPIPGEAAIPGGDLTLNQAIEMALNYRPELAKARAKIEAAAGRMDEAGRLPNPQVIARMESAPLGGGTTRQAEYLAGITQPIPLGGRRAAARTYERAERAWFEREHELLHWSIVREVRNAFATALYSLEALSAQSQLAHAAEELLRITRFLIQEGEAPQSDLVRMEAEMWREDLELARATALKEQAFAGLAAAVGKPGLNLTGLDGSLPDLLNIESQQGKIIRAEDHPQTLLSEAAIQSERARLALVRAERIPDLNLDLLYRRIESSREDAFDAGFTIAVPLFSRGRGRVQEAESLVKAAEAGFLQARNELTESVAGKKLQLSNAIAMVRLLENEILPRLEQSAQIDQARYAEGDIRLAELLLGRRELALARLSYLNQLRAAIDASAALSGPGAALLIK